MLVEGLVDKSGSGLLPPSILKRLRGSVLADLRLEV
jgi:hypothetical protein